MAAFKAKYGYDLGVPKTYKQLRDIAEFFYRPEREALRRRDLHRQHLRRAGDGRRERRSSATAASSATTPPTRCAASSTRSRTSRRSKLYKELYKFTPPGWGKTFFLEDNQAITEGLAAMSMNFFAFFPALANQATNKNAKGTGFFANPGGPDRQALRRARRPGHLDRHLLEEAGRGDEVPRVVHPRRRAEEVGRARRLHLQRQTVLKSEEFRKATPYNEAFYQTHVHGEGLLGDARVRRAARRR